MPSTTTLDIAPFLSQKSQLWKACGTRPNPSTFPLESITMKLKPALAGISVPSSDDDPFNLTLDGDILSEALQYGKTAGVARFIECLEEFQTHRHKRLRDDTWSVAVGSGSQDLMFKGVNNTMQSHHTPSDTQPTDEGDSVLVETPVYPSTLGFLAALPCALIEVHSDGQGLNPRAPKFLYTIPSGSNPTGSSIPEHRKVTVYITHNWYV
ncbi:hypothetical protein B0H17DRAFT_1046125 [Mycena rosella]|uniref:Aminotransferase class I/classII domain-containing protein n=1 Tax=Mycena rosella TaxID=1033263 RepID=A0AAD7DYV2_MYCRO|nr:hypothetical protein B0H17DRAFT_1046125 [Mycena rosella]